MHSDMWSRAEDASQLREVLQNTTNPSSEGVRVGPVVARDFFSQHAAHELLELDTTQHSTDRCPVRVKPVTGVILQPSKRSLQAPGDVSLAPFTFVFSLVSSSGAATRSDEEVDCPQSELLPTVVCVSQLNTEEVANRGEMVAQLIGSIPPLPSPHRGTGATNCPQTTSPPPSRKTTKDEDAKGYTQVIQIPRSTPMAKTAPVSSPLTTKKERPHQNSNSGLGVNKSKGRAGVRKNKAEANVMTNFLKAGASGLEGGSGNGSKKVRVISGAPILPDRKMDESSSSESDESREPDFVDDAASSLSSSAAAIWSDSDDKKSHDWEHPTTESIPSASVIESVPVISSDGYISIHTFRDNSQEDFIQAAQVPSFGDQPQGANRTSALGQGRHAKEGKPIVIELGGPIPQGLKKPMMSSAGSKSHATSVGNTNGNSSASGRKNQQQLQQQGKKKSSGTALSGSGSSRGQQRKGKGPKSSGSGGQTSLGGFINFS